MREELDRKIKREERQAKGAFFTPSNLVEKAHEYVAKNFGENWKEDYIVWDCACGTGNLTNGHEFKELYSSTLEQNELDYIDENGTAFQHDFLNGDNSQLPEGLREAIESGKEILFLINPPYATGSSSTNHGKSKSTASVGNSLTACNTAMKKEKWGGGSKQLYTQFLYRISKIQEENKNVNIAVFAPLSYMASSSFKKFREKFYAIFNMKDGFMFQANHFPDVSGVWGVSFTIWKNK